MSPNDIAKKYGDLVEAGMKAVGSEILPTVDGDTVVLRDIFVEFDREISFYRAGDPVSPFQVMPLEALESAASSLCINVLTGIVTRAVETTES